MRVRVWNVLLSTRGCSRLSEQLLSGKKKHNTAVFQLTEVVGTAEVEDVTAVDVMVQSFLYQVLGLVTCQICHPGEELRSTAVNMLSDLSSFSGKNILYFESTNI